MMSRPKIIIVGAGASGLASAVRLIENGFVDVKILEAENRIGGRINTVPYGKSTVDLGAQWCHGEEENIVYEHCSKFDLLETSKCTYKDNVFYESTGIQLDKEVTDFLFSIATNIIYNDYEKMEDSKDSFGNYFIKTYIQNVIKEFGNNRPLLDVASKFINWYHKLILCYDAPPSWFDISASGLMEYKECEGDPLLNWKDKGYKQFLEVLMKKPPFSNANLKVENKILLNKEVKTIVWETPYSQDVTVHCSDGTTYNADHVIVTASVGVLKDQYKTLFKPELPSYKVNAINSCGFGVVNKILIRFSHRWWREEDTNFCFLWTEDHRMNILNEFPAGPVKDGKSWLEDISGFFVIDSDPTTLIAWIVGEQAREAELLEDQLIEKGCMYLLEKFLGDQYDIPQPCDIICSRWHSNKHFRGSYSFKSMDFARRGLSSSDLARPLVAKENKPVVLFAGEHTHPWYFSTVHGAVETGFREADNLINYFKFNSRNDSKPKLPSKF